MNFRLAALCTSENISCLQLEKKLNIPNAKLNKYCHKLSFPNVYRAIIIANFFNCSLDYLTGLSSIKNNTPLSNANITLFHERLNKLITTEKSKNAFFSKCELDRSNLSRWNKSKDFPKLYNLYLIANHTNTSLDYLTGRTDKKEFSL